MQQIDSNKNREDSMFQSSDNFSNEINIKVTVTTGTTKEMTIEFKVQVNMPFHLFFKQSMKQIFHEDASRVFEIDETIIMFNEAIIPKTETKSLKQLGFKENSQLQAKLKRKGGPQQEVLELSIITSYATGEHNLQIQMNSQTPFNVFIVKALKIIFTEEFPGYEVYLRARIWEDEIMFMLENQVIQRAEQRTLEQLGFRNYSVLHIKLRMRSNQILQ